MSQVWPRLGCRLLIVPMAAALTVSSLRIMVLPACAESVGEPGCCCSAALPTCCEIPTGGPVEQTDPGDGCSCDLAPSAPVPVQTEPASLPDARFTFQFAFFSDVRETASWIAPSHLVSVTRPLSKSRSRIVPLYRRDCTFLL
jgi:hypothetical protein